jgi:hypothetical protein
MQAPISATVRKILADRELSKKLMMAIMAERSNPDDIAARTLVVDGKKFVLARATAVTKTKD